MKPKLKIYDKPTLGVSYVWREETINPDRPHNLYHRWMLLDNEDRVGPVFCKLTPFVHPQSSRMSIAKVVIAKTDAGRLFEGVFSGKTYLPNWLRIENLHPQLVISDSNFLPVLFRQGKKKLAFSSMDYDRNMLRLKMLEYGLLSQSEFEVLMNLSREELSHFMPLSVY